MKPLRVLHVNSSDMNGGAARAARRLHLALRDIGVDSHMLVLDRRETDPYVLQVLSPARRAMHRAKLELSNRLMARQRTPTNPVLHSLNRFSNGLADWINRSDFDVVNLHWLGAEMLSVEEVGRIAKPICWTMHDMWPISGAEHYDDLEHPGRYRSVYTAANRPAGYGGPDLDAWVWRRKRKAWAGKRFQLISPSRWLAGCAGESALMGHQPCSVIPNCIDTEVFKPIDRRLARGILNLDPDKRYILFGAMSSTSDTRKGFHLLQPALQQLAVRPGIAGSTELLVFGANAPAQPPDFGLPVHYMGNFHDEISLALLYNASNVFAAPSLQDNLPNTLVEAIACGTACVAFDLGGMPDLIDDVALGHLARKGSVDDFGNGIARYLASDEQRRALGQQQRASRNIAAAYLHQYNGAVQTTAGTRPVR